MQRENNSKTPEFKQNHKKSTEMKKPTKTGVYHELKPVVSTDRAGQAGSNAMKEVPVKQTRTILSSSSTELIQQFSKELVCYILSNFSA